MAKKKRKDSGVHKDLDGFEIRINEFGEIISSKKVEDLNRFLDENVEDKKLADHPEHAKRDEEE
jgi:hypothetical protein